MDSRPTVDSIAEGPLSIPKAPGAIRGGQGAGNLSGKPAVVYIIISRILSFFEPVQLILCTDQLRRYGSRLVFMLTGGVSISSEFEM